MGLRRRSRSVYSSPAKASFITGTDLLVKLRMVAK